MDAHNLGKCNCRRPSWMTAHSFRRSHRCTLQCPHLHTLRLPDRFRCRKSLLGRNCMLLDPCNQDQTAKKITGPIIHGCVLFIVAGFGHRAAHDFICIADSIAVDVLFTKPPHTPMASTWLPHNHNRPQECRRNRKHGWRRDRHKHRIRPNSNNVHCRTAPLNHSCTHLNPCSQRPDN